MKAALAAFASGLLFAVGLGVSGMTEPARVLGFLDFAHWDPSLALVMGGAIAVYATCYRLARRRRAPVLADRFVLPRDGAAIDARLLAGAALFGVGWGLAGFCPGPALVATVSLDPMPLVFTAFMLLGTGTFRAADRLRRAGSPRTEVRTDTMSMDATCG